MPVIISKIFKGLCADLNGKLNVGDVILKVNNIDFRTVTHDDAVDILKNTEQHVQMDVLHLKELLPYLTVKANLCEDIQLRHAGLVHTRLIKKMNNDDLDDNDECTIEIWSKSYDNKILMRFESIEVCDQWSARLRRSIEKNNATSQYRSGNIKHMDWLLHSRLNQVCIKWSPKYAICTDEALCLYDCIDSSVTADDEHQTNITLLKYPCFTVRRLNAEVDKQNELLLIRHPDVHAANRTSSDLFFCLNDSSLFDLLKSQTLSFIMKTRQMLFGKVTGSVFDA